MPLNMDVTPKQYSEFLKTINLTAIRLISHEMKIDPSASLEDLGYSFKHKCLAAYVNDDAILIGQCDYKCVLTVGSKDKPQEIGFTSGTLLGVYIVDGIAFDDSYLQIFKTNTLLLNLWPFIREYIQSDTMRAGLPPLTLPFYRVG